MPADLIPPSFHLEAFLGSLPHQPGIYRMLDESDEVIYVGKARDLHRRVASYFHRQHENPRTRLMVSRVKRVEVTITRSEVEALLLESNLIKAYSPKFNVLFKDDKSYPYIRISRHPYPQISFFRGEVDDDDAKYFGPYPNALAARETIDHLQKLFRLRTCDDVVFRNRSRPCLLHQIERCSASCVGKITEDAYHQDLGDADRFLRGEESRVLDSLREAMMEASSALDYERAATFRDRIALLQNVLARQVVSSVRLMDADVVAVDSGLLGTAVNLVMIRQGRHLGDRTFFPDNTEGMAPSEILEAFLTHHYAHYPVPSRIIANADNALEETSRLLSIHAGHAVLLIRQPQGEERLWLQSAIKNAHIALEQKRAQQAAQGARLRALQEFLGLPPGGGVFRMECFDISHTQGEATIGACVVFEQGQPLKSDYRTYRVENVTGGDDYAALRQVLERRYRKLVSGEGKWPDLILVDGGRGQVSAAQSVLGEMGVSHVPLLGIAKGVERKPGQEELIFPEPGKQVRLPVEHPGFHLLQAIRDEAHRFAITGHRTRRGKARTRSVLESIPGVGERRRQKLLTRFGGLRGLQNASVEDIAAVNGIGLVLARKIYQQMH